MHEMKDFGDGADLLHYLDELNPDDAIVACLYDNIGHWRTIVAKHGKVLEGAATTSGNLEAKPKKRVGRPKGWKPGQPYV